jgi:hypothetical protein
VLGAVGEVVMNVSLHVIQVSAKGVQVATPASTGEPFWLPKTAVTWSEAPDLGAKVTATIPKWLAAKHQQLVQLRGQYAIPLHPTPGLDPDKAKKAFPMAYDNNLTGALFKNDRRESEKQPFYKGSCEIDGRKYWISAWLKKSQKGETFMSLAFKPAEEQRQQPEPQNAYAAAKAWPAPAAGPTFDREDSIPFGPEVR